MPLVKENCWMSFSEALEQFLNAKADMAHFSAGGYNWLDSKRRYDEAKDHMDALTNSIDLRSD